MNRFPEIDPYDVLGLPRGCSSSDIKAAYKKLALKNHPDRAPHAEKEEATARFKIIGEAYELLSDTRQRRNYDAFGPGSSTTAAGGFASPGDDYEDDETRKHFGTSPDGKPFTFMWESSADSARRAQAGRRAGRPFGADGFDPFELFNMMFSRDFGSTGASGNVGGGRGNDPFGRMGGQSMGGSLFGDDDPFLQNHRRMADTMGFGFGAPPFAAAPRSPMGMQTQSSGPFSAGFNTSNSTSTSTSTTFGGFSGTSESTTTRIVNGRKETVTRKVDASGNETVHISTPEGSSVHVNGVQQANHPLLRNAGAAAPILPSAGIGRAVNARGTADNPIVIESESEPSAPANAHSGGVWGQQAPDQLAPCTCWDCNHPS
ncbi:uncharacterized protein UTRI_05302_B [Ustilago trichophora]|uniref:J domain-containing protein n=1 Tax=Ustilago trichophora TaxID=86804 RepID=A0A5C3EPA5_9BASI|nr:uncharacterized protein UTRI_05302_B [Ustilago trichophora]